MNVWVNFCANVLVRDYFGEYSACLYHIFMGTVRILV